MRDALRALTRRVTDPVNRAGLVDNSVRYLGALAVVFTVEAICGFYLWRGATVNVQLPPQLGWAPQLGLVGGAAVGTRAWHRGDGSSASWGMAASLVGLGFTVVDAGVAALLRDGILNLRAGWLALGLIVECVIIGWLAVHTLFSAAKSEQVSGVVGPQPPVVDDQGDEPVTAPLPIVALTPLRLPQPPTPVNGHSVNGPQASLNPPPPESPSTAVDDAPRPAGDDDELMVRLRQLRDDNGGTWPAKQKVRAALRTGWDTVNRLLDRLDAEDRETVAS